MVNLRSLMLATVAMLATATAARADVFTVDVYTGDIGHAFDAVNGSAALFTAANNSQHARFTYTGLLDFANTSAQNTTNKGDLNSGFFGANAGGISDYVAITSKTADYGSFATLSSFLAASGSIAGYGYGSLYLIVDNAPIAGGTKLAITHDDGVGVYANGALLPGTTTGPTTVVTEFATIAAPSTVSLAYGRENGTPSVLRVSVVPEPMTLTLLGAGLLGLGLARRRA